MKKQNIHKLFSLMLFLSMTFMGKAQIFVDIDAAPGGNGNSWATAYKDLQDAIDDADATTEEIWVAAGTYKPTVEFDADGSGGNDTRERTFYINQDGIKIYGGFAGTETMLSQRPAGAKSTLSGDFMSNDVFDVNNGGYQGTTGDDNAYHVVYVNGKKNDDGTSNDITIATVIDGFSIVEGNAADEFSPNNRGGGIYNNGNNGGNSNPTIANCSFSNNHASKGGGIYNDGKFNGYSSPSIANCSFSNNNASLGGGIYNNGNDGNSSPSIANCSFSNNRATSGGGGGAILYFRNNGSLKSQVVNCLFNNNGIYHIYYDDGDAHFINCTFTGATSRVMFQVIDSDMTPVDFTNCIFWDNNGDITNLANSFVNLNHCLVEEAAFVGSNNNIGEDPIFNDAANNDYTLKSCSPALNVGDNTANTTTTDLADNPRKFNTTIDMGAYEFQAATATCCPFSTTQPIFVKHNAAGNNDGTTWANAYTDLQDAIDNWCGGAEIWVAAGTYKPTVEFDADESGGTNDRERTFYINQDGIKIYGGFSGTETMLSQRPAGAKSTLSGDFMSNDVFDVNNGGYQGTTGDDNAYHVVYVDGTSSPVTIATVIDGFSIVEGNANGASQNREGGGIHNDGENGGNSSPTISNCSFSNNSANSGSGIYNNGDSGNSSPTISNCSFSNNSANDGGGIYNNGGFGNSSSSPYIVNCSFSNNSANIGGGISNYGFNGGNCKPIIANCSFSNNTANRGSGIHTYGDNGSVKSQIVNCIFNSNGAEHIFYDDGNVNQQPHFINCTFTGATTQVIEQLMNSGMTPVDFTNCIFWDNNGDITNLANTNVNINHSLIEEAGFTGGMNNIINQDPLFTDAVNDDFTVQYCSPAIDVGDNTANTSTTALGGNNRKINNTIDMGAYEYNGLICPSISIATTTASVSELNTDKLIYQFTRQDGILNQSLEVHFQISNSSTASAVDYTVTEMGTGMVDFNENTLIGTITFPANQTTVVLEIVPQIDGTIESNETIVVEVIAAP